MLQHLCLFALLLLWQHKLLFGLRITRPRKSGSLQQSSTYRDLMDDINDSKEWYSLGGCNILFPQGGAVGALPQSIVHFTGGFLVGTDGIVSIAYSSMLLNIAKSGHLVVVTPFQPLTMDHDTTSQDISKLFTNCYKNNIVPLLSGSSNSSSVRDAVRSIPIIGLSHSLGSKLTALMCSRKEDRKALPYRVANIFLAFNNYGIEEQFDMFGSQAAASSPLPPDVRRVIDAFMASNELKNFISGKVGINVKKVIAGAVERARERFEDMGLDTLSDSIFGDLIGKIGDNINNVAGKAMNSAKRGKAVGGVLSTLWSSTIGDAAASSADASASSSDDEITVPNFTPTPAETLARIQGGYNVQNNVLVKFSSDEIDQSPLLADVLRVRGCDVSVLELSGGHLTPNFVTSIDGSRPRDREDAILFNRRLISTINGICSKYWDGIDGDIRRTMYSLPVPGDPGRRQ